MSITRGTWITLSIAVISVVLLFSLGATAQQATPKAPVRTPPPRPDSDFDRLGANSESLVRYQEYEKTPLSFSSSAQYVLVPAVVLAKDGSPVHGLTKQDFHILENGKEQKVSSAEEFTSTAKPIATPAPKTNRTTNIIATQDTTPRRLVVIAFDLVNTPFTDQNRAKKQLISFLADNVTTSNLYQLVFIDLGGVHVIHDFTDDTSSLVSGLAQLKARTNGLDRIDKDLLRNQAVVTAGSAQPGAIADPAVGNSDKGASAINFSLGSAAGSGGLSERMLAYLAAAELPEAARAQADAAAATLKAFQQIAERLAGVPGRKSLVWISGGFPFSLDPASASISEGVAFAYYQHTMQILANQSIAVYPVDARGLLTVEPDASNAARKRAPRAGAMLADESARQLDILNTMRAFADMTGGHAYVNSNDTATALSEAARDGESYYVLSYAVNKSDRRPGWRKLSVKVADRQVRARTGYYLTQATLDPQSSAKLDIENALASPVNYTGIPVNMVFEPPAAGAGRRKVSFAMQVPPNSTTVDAASNNHLFVEIAYVVRNQAGQDVGHKGVTYNLNLNAAQLQALASSGVGYNDSVELAPGRYNLRLVVRDNLNGRMGSVAARLEVE